MCGRFTLRTPTPVLIQHFELGQIPPLPPRFNIAPTQSIAAVRVLAAGAERQLDLLHWGLIPSWAKEPSIGNRLINARAETLAEKPSFRDAYRKRRCLIAADGFYEWKKVGSKKQPYYITRKDQLPFAFAGLWEQWRDRTLRNAPLLESCTIITTDANELVEDLHDRMPVILEPGDFDLWLNPDEHDPKRLDPLLRPAPADGLTAYPVSPLVNRPTSDTPECVERL